MGFWWRFDIINFDCYYSVMIYFVRHGETEYNRQGRVQGHLDIPLNAKGISQAEQAREVCKDKAIDLIYCSPLQRAKKTAEIINEYHNVEVVVDKRLIELYSGSVQGKTIKECTEEELKYAFNKPEKNNGESLPDFFKRVKESYDDILALNKNVLIVSHGGVYRALYKIANNIDGFDLEIETPKNAEVIEIKKAR
ncbi:MAG: histidine phosphatase family protein [Clostridiales bacterium]|nr:histidine phosphatase family protein [Clostridiales bacterium]